MTILCQATGNKLKRGEEGTKDNVPKIAVAYVQSERKGLPNPYMFSHLIYAFAKFNDDFDDIVIDNLEKLKGMVDLKNQNPELKVMIGIGGRKREGFSEMSRDRRKRISFVKNIKHIIDSLNLDGIDLDWEFPTTEKGGHTACPKDDQNYVSLVKDLRKALGKDKWISYYSLNSGAFIDQKGMEPYVDYIHVSGYDMAIPKKGEPLIHHSPLYSSTHLGPWCVKNSVEKHISLGIPKEKILIGIPFFGRGKKPFPGYVDCTLLYKYVGNLKPMWDNEAQAPFFEDEKGILVLGYDNEQSIAAKFDFIRVNGLPGIFIWNYDADFEDNRLGKTIQKLRK